MPRHPDRERQAGLGFFSGLRALPGAAGWLLARPAAWPYALVPALVLGLLSAGAVTLALSTVRPALEGLIGQGEAWHLRLLRAALPWVGTALAAVLGLMVALALTPPLSSPALERLVDLRERELSLPPRAPLGFFAEIACGLRAQALAAAFALPLLAALWVTELAFPPAVVVTLPAKYLVVAFGLAWNLFDYPLTLRGVPMRRRLRLFSQHRAAVIGFGAGFALLFWVPCFSVVLLPLGVVAATELCWTLQGAVGDAVAEAAATQLPE